jgi:hypothetical protein
VIAALNPAVSRAHRKGYHSSAEGTKIPARFRVMPIVP